MFFDEIERRVIVPTGFFSSREFDYEDIKDRIIEESFGGHSSGCCPNYIGEVKFQTRDGEILHGSIYSAVVNTGSGF